MLFSTFVLVSVDREHDRLEKRIDFGHGHQSAQVCDVTGLRLEEKQQVSVLLSLLIIRKETLLQFGRIIEVAGNFVLLFGPSVPGLSLWP